MRSITEAGDLKDKRVLVRVDWNVPMEEGKIVDNSRMLTSLETIKYILDKGGEPIIISHLGRNGGSLKPVFEEFNKIIPASFLEDPFIENIKVDGVTVLENIRKWPEEEAGDEEFGKKLASLGDVYVNEAFSSSHDNHASIVEVPKFLPHFAGFNFMREVENLSKAFEPPHPFLFILGGAKFETKLPVLKKFLDVADYIFIGGAVAAQAVKDPELKDHPKIIWPVGDIAALDANEETLDILKTKIENAKFVLWNGPLGNYENGYTEGTNKLAEILANSKAETIVGGGDTDAVIKDDLESKFSFVSHSGGAMLTFLATETLPGIFALN